MIEEGFVLEPYYELVPDYKISPFNTNSVALNKSLRNSNKIYRYLNDRFGIDNWVLSSNGREAIFLALSDLELSKSDYITIFTTSGNSYISSCVTNEIEKFCNWSRKIEKNTKAILVNHEFGFPFKYLKELKKHNLPIIEDCAYSFLSSDVKNDVGMIGDYAIYSFPKIFPIQFGGLLVSKRSISNGGLNKPSKEYLVKVLSYYIKKSKEIIENRITNYFYLSALFEKIGLTPFFQLQEGITPGVFMFNAKHLSGKLPELKQILYKHGIQCSVFYGKDAFFIPCHQNLKKSDLDYFFAVVKKYSKELL